MNREKKYTKIKSIEQYNEYCDLHEKMMDEESVFLEDLELLEVLIDDYDNRMKGNEIEKLDPVKLLKFFLEENQMTEKQLSQELGVPIQLVYDILNYRRAISETLVIHLAKLFAVAESAFDRKYPLRKDARPMRNVRNLRAQKRRSKSRNVKKRSFAV